MAEKVIFEFRAQEGENGCEFVFEHGGAKWAASDSSFWACCRDAEKSERPAAERQRRTRQSGDRSGRNMRETLNFLQGLYDELYGESQI